jgi:DNA processing protein
MYAKRNRIVAALANLGVIVIEAGEKSGSLLTAEYAIKLRRPLYAVPGPINSETSKGTNWLIQSGKAQLITSIHDIKAIRRIKNTKIDMKSSLSHSPFENKILELLKTDGTPLALDEIVVLTGLDVTEVSTQISLLHLQGLIDEINGKYAVKM